MPNQTDRHRFKATEKPAPPEGRSPVRRRRRIVESSPERRLSSRDHHVFLKDRAGRRKVMDRDMKTLEPDIAEAPRVSLPLKSARVYTVSFHIDVHLNPDGRFFAARHDFW